MRALTSVLVVSLAARAFAAEPAASTNEAEPPTGIYEAPPKNDPPRWRVRGRVATGAGVGLGGVRATSVPTQLELGARIWGPLSFSLGGMAVLASRAVTSCGALVRPNAALGTIGLRANLRNGRSASWIDPFIEAHAGVGGQAAYAEPGDPCGSPRVFASGGARVGIDAWLGRVAITAQVSYDHLPIGAPLAVSIGASVILY